MSPAASASPPPTPASPRATATASATRTALRDHAGHATATAPARVAARHMLAEGGFALPTPVELIADALADVRNVANLPTGLDIVSLQPLTGSRPTLLVHERLQADAGRRRIALAHALAHIVLPWHAGVCGCRPLAERTAQLDDTWGLIESEASAFACEVLAPTEWLNATIDVDAPLATIRTVAAATGIPLAAAAAASAWVFPPGLVWMLTDRDGYVHAAGRSPGTPAQAPEPGTALDATDVQQRADRRDSVRLKNGDTLHTLRFPAPKLGHHAAQLTDSTVIISAIVADLGIPERDRSDLVGAVQGIVGGIEMVGPLVTLPELELELEWRFRDRPTIAHITQHARFADFVHAKAGELAARRVGW